jgi:hypothetical protein
MSNRRSTAATATATDKANRRTLPTEYVAGSGGVTATERAALADGIRAGAKQRLRLAARDIVLTVAALRADGIDPGERAYRMTECDPETGENLDAREVLREAVERAKAGRGFGIGANDPGRMTADDVARLAAYGANCAGRMARRPRLTDDERLDIGAEIAAAIVERGTDVTDGRCADWFHAPYGTVRTDARTMRLEAAMSTLPRWDALNPDDWSGAPTEGDRSRDRWKGFAYMTARRLILARHERVTSEMSADWSDSGEDAPTPEQRAATAADIATAVVTTALESAAPLTYFLSATAPGGALKQPEIDALSLGLTGLSRADLAAARGVDAEAVKKGAQRGRKSLLTRVDNVTAAREWARAADARMARLIYAPTDEERAARIMVGTLSPNRRVRLSWPDRIGRMEADAYVIPPAPSGAGTRANVPALAYGPAEREPMPRATRSGAPTLTHRQLLAPLARAWRTMGRIGLRQTSDLDTSGAVVIAPRKPTVAGHPAPALERVRMQRDARAADARSARWVFPEYATVG